MLLKLRPNNAVDQKLIVAQLVNRFFHILNPKITVFRRAPTEFRTNLLQSPLYVSVNIYFHFDVSLPHGVLPQGIFSSGCQTIIIRRPLTAEARICARVSHVGFMVDKVALGQDFFSEFFGFLVSVSFHLSPCSYITWGMNSRPVGGRSSETSSHPNDINNWNYVLPIISPKCVLHDSPFSSLNWSLW
jgi:hypothetical protein